MENKQEQYMVVVDGKPQGPYALSQLPDLKIQPSTFLRKPGMDDYKEAHEFAEIRELLGFTYERTAPQYFASFDQRLLAWTVDYFLVTVVYVFLVLMSFFIVPEQEQRIIIIIIAALLIPVTKLIYGIVTEASVQQATVGKRLLSIKVTDLTGKRITLTVSFIRHIAKVFSILPLFFGYLYSFLNKKQQCWHDIVANTVVIKDRLI